MNNIISVEEINKSYILPDGERLTVLHSVSFDVQSGECISILGKSGCGKTTLLRIIAGLELPDSGKILYNGKKITQSNVSIALVPQDFSAFPWLTVLENISFGLRLKGIGNKVRMEKAREICAMLELTRFEHSYSGTLSGGMQQRVAIGRAIAVEPSLLLLDEPFGSLDAQTREQMQDMFLSMRSKFNMTMIFVTHDIEESLYIADKYVLINTANRAITLKGTVELPTKRYQELKMTPDFQKQRKLLRQYLVNEREG